MILRWTFLSGIYRLFKCCAFATHCSMGSFSPWWSDLWCLLLRCKSEAHFPTRAERGGERSVWPVFETYLYTMARGGGIGHMIRGVRRKAKCISPATTHKPPSPWPNMLCFEKDGNWTRDFWRDRPILYQLSYFLYQRGRSDVKQCDMVRCGEDSCAALRLVSWRTSLTDNADLNETNIYLSYGCYYTDDALRFRERCRAKRAEQCCVLCVKRGEQVVPVFASEQGRFRDLSFLNWALTHGKRASLSRTWPWLDHIIKVCFVSLLSFQPAIPHLLIYSYRARSLLFYPNPSPFYYPKNTVIYNTVTIHTCFTWKRRVKRKGNVRGGGAECSPKMNDYFQAKYVPHNTT